MLDSLPAAPGTTLLTLDGETYKTTPIVGWGIAKSGRAEPITAAVPQPIKHGTAYLIPLGAGEGIAIFDPVYGTTATTVEDWLAFVRKKTASVKAAEETGTIPYAALGVVFGDKTFVKASYWIFRDGTHEFIFEVEGGEPLPTDSRITKSNRKDFMTLKKHMTVATVEELLAEAPDEPETEDEIEADLDDEAEDLI